MSSTFGLDPTDVVRLLGRPASALGGRPHHLPIQVGEASRLVFRTEPAGVAVEQYRILRRRLVNLHAKGGVMLVTSPSPGDGKTLTSINLAFCLAEAGHATCLVDLDFRAPGFELALGCAIQQNGVEEVLLGTQTIAASVHQMGDHPLHVLGIQKRRATPGPLLSPALVLPFLANLRSRYEWILLDFAPMIPMADVGEMLPHVDGSLMVVRCDKTERAMLAPCFEILGTKLWGVVVNDSEISGSAYYGSYGNIGKRRK